MLTVFFTNTPRNEPTRFVDNVKLEQKHFTVPLYLYLRD